MKAKNFLQKIVSAVVAIIMVVAMIPTVSVLAREYAADVSINGITVQFKNEPYSKDDIIFVPLEEICGYLNLGITKEGDTYTVARKGQVLKMELGNLIAFLDGKEVELSTNLEEKNGVAYAPIDVFSAGFGCPVVVSDNKRRADLTPNVYRVRIDENHAAAISAGKPDDDVLAAGTSGTDKLFYNPTNFPELEKSLFYMIDFSAFAGLKLQKVELMLTLKQIEYDPTLRVVRTAPWTKGSITYNMQPVIYEDEYTQKALTKSGFIGVSYDITALANSAKLSGEELGVKVLGVPFPSKMNSTNMSFDVKGVQTDEAPYVTVTAEEKYTFPIKSDVEENSEDETRYSKLALLKGLGVFTESDEFPLDLSEGVQRQEFVRYALRLRNASVQEASGEQFFSDVPTDAPFYNDVMTAHSMGLVSGWQGIAFRPYDIITTGEAITILGRMLNYNIFADERGGFTPGYFAAARNGDLYNGAEIPGEELSFKKMFNLLEGALDAKMLNVRSYSSNGTAEYTFDENMTILTEYWNAQVIEGTVTANEYTSLAGGSGKEGIIEIEGKKLKLSFKPYNDFLGYKVKAYYEKREEKLLYMGNKEYDITEIDLADITSKNKSGKVVSFNYEKENGSIGKESFSFEKDKKHIVYNGKSVTETEFGKKGASLLDGDAGSIKLVGDSLAVITAYKTLVIFSVNASDEVIYDAYDKYDGILRLSNVEYSFADAKNNEVLLENIKNGDVLSFAESLDKKLVSGIVSEKKVTGKIDMLENAGTTEENITVDGKVYETVNRKEAWTKFIKLGTNATFYIDAFGRIAAMDAVQAEKILGYLLAVADSGRSCIRKQLQAAIVVKGIEEYQVYDLADKVKIDGDKMDDVEKIKKHFRLDTAGNDTGDIITQGIIFDVDDSGKIKEIDTRYKGANEEQENTLYEWTFDSDARYHGEGIAEKFYLYLTDALGVMQYEPDNPALEDFESITTLAGNTTHPFKQVYTIGKHNPEVKIAKLTGARSGGSISSGASPVIVDRIVTAFDKDGLEIGKLYYYSGTKRSSVIVPAENSDLLVKKYYTYTRDSAKPEETSTVAITTPDSLVTATTLVKRSDIAGKNIERGDVIRFATNAKGELTALQVLYEYSTKSLNDYYNDLALNSANEDRTMSGYTTMVADHYVRLSKLASIDDAVDYKWFDIKKFPEFVKYEVSSSGVEVSTAAASDIRTFEKIPHNPTGIILQNVYTSIRGSVVLVDMAQPAGTGAYTLTYSLGENGDTYNGVPTTPVRCEPDGSVTVTANVPVGKKDVDRNIAYEFSHWEDEDDNRVNSGIITLTKNTVLTAQWNEIELPRYIYLKESVGATEASATITVYKEAGVYSTTVPSVTKGDGSYYFAKTGFGYYNWVDESDAEYTPGASLTLTEDLTLYPNWKEEITATANITTDGGMDLVEIRPGAAVRDSVETVDNNIDAEDGRWYLAKVKIGSGYSSFTSMKFGICAAYSSGNAEFYCVPLKKTDFDTAKTAAANSQTLTTLTAPYLSGCSSLGTYAGKSGTWFTVEADLDPTLFTSDHYDGEFIYVAFQMKELDTASWKYAFWNSKRSYFKMTVKGLKED